MAFYSQARAMIDTGPVDGTTYTTTIRDNLALGTVVTLNDGSQWIYVKSNTDLSAGSAKEPVKFSAAFVLARSGSGGPAYGPMPSWADADASTTNRFGWLQIGGIASCTTDGNVAAGDMIAWACSGSAEFIEIGTIDEAGAATYDEKAINARGIALEDDAATTGNILLFPIFPDTH